MEYWGIPGQASHWGAIHFSRILYPSIAASSGPPSRSPETQTEWP